MRNVKRYRVEGYSVKGNKIKNRAFKHYNTITLNAITRFYGTV